MPERLARLAGDRSRAKGYQVTVDRGEVFFQVGGSPLQVIAHGVSISGSETSFSVRDYGHGDADIVSLEGVVHIDPLAAEHVTTTSEAHRDQVVSAGQWAAVRNRHLTLNYVGRSTIRRKLMWRYGMVEFADNKVEEAAAELNRYNGTKLVVDDHAKGCRRIGGRFSVTRSWRIRRLNEQNIVCTQEFH